MLAASPQRQWNNTQQLLLYGSGVFVGLLVFVLASSETPEELAPSKKISGSVAFQQPAFVDSQEKVAQQVAKSKPGKPGVAQKAPQAVQPTTTSGVEEAIDYSLEWLKKTQENAGHWSAGDWRGIDEVDIQSNDAGDSDFDLAMTGLALLAFLESGHSHRFGRYKRTVSRGARWIRKQQDNNTGRFGSGKRALNHVLGTFTLCYLFGFSRDFRLRKPCQKALAYLLEQQNANGSWGESAGNIFDTAWAVACFKEAKRAGLKVPNLKSAADYALRLVDSYGVCQYAEGDWGYGRSECFGNQDVSPVNTACVGVVVAAAAVKPKKSLSLGLERMVEAGSEFRWDQQRSVNLHFWFFGTLALTELRQPKRMEWLRRGQELLLKLEVLKGQLAGSVPPIDPWCRQGGRVFATAMSRIIYERMDDLHDRLGWSSNDDNDESD